MKKLIILFLLLSFCLFYTFSQQDQYEIISEQKIEYRDVNSVYYHSPTSVVSYQQIVEDIDNLKYLLKTCYAGYEDALARGLDLEKFEQNILSEFSNSIYDKNSISTDKICDVVYNELKNYVIDNHFSIYGASTECILSNVNRVLYSNIYVREKNGKYFVVESDIPEIKKKSEFTGSKENLFLYPAKGKNIYRVGFTKTIESSAENDYIENEIELSFNNENRKVLIKTYDSIKNTKIFFGKQETKDTGYLSLSTFDLPDVKSNFRKYAERSFEKYINSSVELNNKKNVIIDLRGNSGGNNYYSNKFLSSLYTNKILSDSELQKTKLLDNDVNYTESYNYSSPWIANTMNNYFSQMGMADFIFPYIQSDIENFKTEPKKIIRKWIDTSSEYIGECNFAGKVIIITDRNSASSSEDTIQLAKRLFGKNCYLVGENSKGCFSYGNILPYQLPNKSLCLYVPSSIFMNYANSEYYNIEGIGFTPDYWSTNEDLLETLVAITGDKSLRKVLHGIEVELK